MRRSQLTNKNYLHFSKHKPKAPTEIPTTCRGLLSTHFLFQVPPTVSYSYKRYKLKKNNQKTQPIPTPLPSPKKSHPT